MTVQGTFGACACGYPPAPVTAAELDYLIASRQCPPVTEEARRILSALLELRRRRGLERCETCGRKHE